MLTINQIAFFARNGFLQVSDLVSSQVCDVMVDLTWERLPALWSRSNPDTWQGVVTDSCHSGDLRARRGHMKFQEKHTNNPVITGAFGAPSIIGQLARALIGYPIGPVRFRGLYSIAPLHIDLDPYSPPHIEAHACQLIALCYLDDVPEGGGGLLVWPGSHRDIYPVMGSKLEYVAGEKYESVYEGWAARRPLGLAGKKGDIVIIHHRLLHAPALNTSNKIRFGFLCDYQREDFCKLCKETPNEDLWLDWPAIAALPQPLISAPADFSLPLLDRPRLPKRISNSGAPTVARKAIASMLARLRKPGEYWLTISDDPAILSRVSLDPCGSDLQSAGVEVQVNGKPFASRSKYDIVERIELLAGENRIDVAGVDRKLWLRLLRIELPFTDSVIVHHQELVSQTATIIYRS